MQIQGPGKRGKSPVVAEAIGEIGIYLASQETGDIARTVVWPSLNKTGG
jgi:hypothetical protein